MTAVTTLLPPPILRILYRPEGKGPNGLTTGGEVTSEVQVSGQMS
jgi:hypothetical protein